MANKFSMTFAGQDFKDLITIEEVTRPPFSGVHNELIEYTRKTGGRFVRDHREPLYIQVKFNVVNPSLSPLRRLLGQLLYTDHLAKLIFSDEPNKVYYAKIDGQPSFDEGYRYAKGDLTFLVPDGVAYQATPTEKLYQDAHSFIIENLGSDIMYPRFEITPKADTSMVGIVGKNAVYQWGQALDQAPSVEQKPPSGSGGTTTTVKRRRRAWFDSPLAEELSSYVSYPQISQVHDWAGGGSFSTTDERGLRSLSTGQRVTISTAATHWQTGERMANWVKGNAYQIVQKKNINKSRSREAYLLKNGQYNLGWLMQQDAVEAVTTSRGSAITPNYGQRQSGWHGAAIAKKIPSEYQSTHWAARMRFSFEKASNNQMGSIYLGIVDANHKEIVGFYLSSHDNSQRAYPELSVKSKGLIYPDYRELGGKFANFRGYVDYAVEGKDLRYEVYNDINGAKLRQTFTVNALGEDTPAYFVIWAGRYGSFTPVKYISIDSTEFTSLNTTVTIDPDTTPINEPEPKHVLRRGDFLEIDMDTNKSYVNGAPSLDPIDFGSKVVGIPPGRHEIMVVTSADRPPDVMVRYREVYL